MQGLQPREVLDDSLRNAHCHQDQELKWRYKGSKRVGCLCSFRYNIRIESLHFHWCGSYSPNPMQILAGFYDTIGYTLFLLLLQTIVVCVRWLHEISVRDYHVVVVLPNIALETLWHLLGRPISWCMFWWFSRKLSPRIKTQSIWRNRFLLENG